MMVELSQFLGHRLQAARVMTGGSIINWNESKQRGLQSIPGLPAIVNKTAEASYIIREDYNS